MRAVALVAHPDDCVIFAWPFIEAHPMFDWTIVYLTYKEHEPRSREIQAYWNKRSISTAFMGYKDNFLDLVTEKFNFWDPDVVSEQVRSNVETYNPDLILTHFEDGEYGHIHHILVHQIAKSIGKPKVYFASTFNYNTEYVVKEAVAVEELPLHKTVIEEFTDRNTGRYIVTPEAELILKEKQ